MSGYNRMKRLLDLSILATASIPASVIGLGCAVAIKTTTKGPVFFKQERIGRDGQPFDVYKFRSMTNGPNPIVPEPDRITPIGQILRRWSLDELPQLINVARGDMSIVGPRPTLGYQVDRYTVEQHRRLEVRPGLTGLAQVSGRNALSWNERIALDIDYIDRASLRLDLSILARTIRTLISGEGIEGHCASDPLVDVDDHAIELDTVVLVERESSALC